MEDLSFEELEVINCMSDPLYYLKNYGKIFDADKGELSGFQPYPYQERVIKKFDAFQNNIILKSRQCVPKGTFIDTPNGPEEINNLKKGDIIYSFNFLENKRESDIVDDSWKSGDRICIEIKLSDGRVVEVGENHPFYVKGKGWVRARDLKIGDRAQDVDLGFGDVNYSKKDIKKISKEKVLPKEVFSFDRESTVYLAKCILKNKSLVNSIDKESKSIIGVAIFSSNKFLLEQLKILLRKLNIYSNIKDLKTCSSLSVTDSTSIDLLYKLVDGNYPKEKQDNTEVTISDLIYTKEKECYDISVKNNKNFLIDGLVVHNTGLSVTTAGFVAWTALFNHDQRILIIANDFNGAKRFLQTVKTFVNNTPGFLMPESILKNNQSELVFSNGSYVKAVASSPEAGRGESLTMLVLDEAAFIEHAEEINMGAGLAVSRTGGKTIAISTPNGTSGNYYKTWQNAVKRLNTYKTSVIHWKDNPFCSQGLEVIEQEDGTIRYWSPWYEEMRAQLNYDDVKIAQELDLSFEGSKATVIPESVRKYYNQKTHGNNPICYFDYKNYQMELDPFVKDKNGFWVYHKPNKDSKYILAADVALGTGKDFSTIQIIDAISMTQVAECHIKTSPHEFAYVIYAAAKIYNDAYTAVEFNSIGSSTCYELYKNIGYTNVYKFQSDKKVWGGPRDNRWTFNEGESVPGFRTTSRSRDLLIGALKKYLTDKSLELNSPRVVTEMETFIQKPNGKIEHEKGNNDDLIMALAIACYIKEYVWSKEIEGKSMYKAMLGAMSYSHNQYSSNMSRGDINDMQSKKKQANDRDKKGGLKPIYFGDEPISGNNKNHEGSVDDDLDWLLG